MYCSAMVALGNYYKSGDTLKVEKAKCIVWTSEIRKKGKGQRSLLVFRVKQPSEGLYLYRVREYWRKVGVVVVNKGKRMK